MDLEIMTRTTKKIPISDIILNEGIYSREKIDQKRVGVFAENIRDNFKFEPIEVEPHPDKAGSLPISFRPLCHRNASMRGSYPQRKRREYSG